MYYIGDLFYWDKDMPDNYDNKPFHMLKLYKEIADVLYYNYMEQKLKTGCGEGWKYANKSL